MNWGEKSLQLGEKIIFLLLSMDKRYNYISNNDIMRTIN